MARFWMVLPFLMLIGCMGRNADLVGQENVRLSEYGLTDDQPAILAFGALWCKPCRAEIPVLNQLQHDFGDRIQILSLLVEGELRGSSADSESIEAFQGPQLEKPAFQIRPDPNWVWFDQLKAKEGRQLPTMVFVRSNGQIDRITQRSLDYDSELKPLAEQLLSGKSLTPDQPQTGDTGAVLKDSLANWTQKSGNHLQEPKLVNMIASHTKGRLQSGFSEHSMQFLDGQIYYRESASGDIPVKGFWSYKSENGVCSLTIIFKADGTASNITGICVPSY